MINYNESNVTGTSWQRCHTIQISNQFEQPRIINFIEERIFLLDDNTRFNQYMPGCQTPYNAETSFPILDSNENPTGETMTHAELYQALYSLYIQAARARDL
jgi:hypothetical protein